MNKKYYKNSERGYTIIETMIAVSLFVVIVVAGIGALLNANLIHHQSANMRSIMDNLTFIMEDMSRHIRTGYNYRCYYPPGNSWNGDQINNPVLNTPRSCAWGGAIVFEEAYGTAAEAGEPNVGDQWVYKIEAPTVGEDFNIWKSTNGGVDFVRLNDASVVIDEDSGFSVLGAEPPDAGLTSGNLQQPMVTIRLKGEIHYKDQVTSFALQTTVTQRLIDVTP